MASLKRSGKVICIGRNYACVTPLCPSFAECVFEALLSLTRIQGPHHGAQQRPAEAALLLPEAYVVHPASRRGPGDPAKGRQPAL